MTVRRGRHPAQPARKGRRRASSFNVGRLFEELTRSSPASKRWPSPAYGGYWAWPPSGRQAARRRSTWPSLAASLSVVRPCSFMTKSQIPEYPKTGDYPSLADRLLSAATSILTSPPSARRRIPASRLSLAPRSVLASTGDNQPSVWGRLYGVLSGAKPTSGEMLDAASSGFRLL